MPVLHIQRRPEGILLTFVRDRRHREEIEYRIPKEHRTPLPFLEGYRVERRLEPLVLSMAQDWCAPHGLCPVCWKGSFCNDWKETAQNKLDAARIQHPEWFLPPMGSFEDERATWHLLCVLSPGEEQRWLLLKKGLPRWAPSVLRVCAEFGYYDEEDLDAWSIGTGSVGRIRKTFEQKKSESTWCSRCLQGNACEAWSVSKLTENGYRPRAPNRRRKPPVWKEERIVRAVEILGIAWPTTPDQIKSAFARQALKHHPDHGGSNEAMKRLILARETLNVSMRTASDR